MTDFAAFNAVVTHVLPEPNYTAIWCPKNILTLHDIESPPGLDWAESLGGPAYLQNPAEQVSVHFVVDGDSIVQGRAVHDWAWHCGTPGSRPSVGIEQAGYASFTRAQWLGTADAVGSYYLRPDGSRALYTAADASSMAGQINVMATLFLALSRELSIDLRWLAGRETNTAVNDPSVTGWNRHYDMSNYLDGTSTSHHDTGDNYPCDVLLAKVHSLAAGRPTVTTLPVPPPPPPVKDGFDMATLPELKKIVGDQHRPGGLVKFHPKSGGVGVGGFQAGWSGISGGSAQEDRIDAAMAAAGLELPDLGVLVPADILVLFGKQH